MFRKVEVQIKTYSGKERKKQATVMEKSPHTFTYSICYIPQYKLVITHLYAHNKTLVQCYCLKVIILSMK